jgi:hypothetical protein
MIIEQAIYGEVRSGHALRMASTRTPLIEGLSSRLDLPDTAPPGVQWSPYITGFPHEDKYILARTFSDPNSTRAGMVISHALIVPIEDIVTVANLKLLFAHLIVAPEAPSSIDTLEIPISVESPDNGIDLIPTAEALVTRGNGPAVQIGICGFEDLIVDLWFNLWPELRETFAFRLSFGPKDIVELPQPAIVCTPSKLEARWSGNKIIRLSSSGDVSQAAAIISGSAEASPILTFANELGVRLDELANLPLLAHAYELDSISTPTFEATLTTIRLIDKLSPRPDVGLEGKKNLISKLCFQVGEVDIASILQMRNLSTKAFYEASCIWDSLEDWVAKNALKKTDDTSFLTAIDDSFSSVAAIEDWRKAILGGIIKSSLSISPNFPDAFWRWAHIKPKTLAGLFEHLPSDDELNTRLSSAVPRNMAVTVGEAIMTLALSKKWLHLHGAAAGGCLEPSEAAYRQMSIDTEPTHIDGIKAALIRATECQLVELAIETDEKRIIYITAEKVAHLPSLLKSVNFNIASAQRLWAQALVINIDSWKGPENPKDSLFGIIQGLLAAKETSSELLEALSTSPVADLCDYEHREELWDRLTEPTRTQFLKATVIGWFEKSLAGNIIAPDPQLEMAITANINLDTNIKTLALTDIKIAMQLINVLPTYTELRFIPLLKCWLLAHRRMGFSEAEFLGNIISKRHWQRAVNFLISAVKSGQNEVKPALSNCLDMVGYFDKWTLGLSVITRDDKWLILEELTVDLYPRGPDDNELWERAGGQNYHLKTSGTGQARWHNALSLIRRGSAPSVVQLLAEMNHDFPTNAQINHLSNDFQTTVFQ